MTSATPRSTQESGCSYDAVDSASPGIFWGFGDQVEGPISHNDIDPVLFAGVIDDLSAEEQKHRTQIRNTEFSAISEKNNIAKLTIHSQTVTEKPDTFLEVVIAVSSGGSQAPVCSRGRDCGPASGLSLLRLLSLPTQGPLLLSQASEGLRQQPLTLACTFPWFLLLLFNGRTPTRGLISSEILPNSSQLSIMI